MSIDSSALAARIGTPDGPKVVAALATATTLYGEAVKDAFREIPEGVADECLLSIGYAVWDRTKSSYGVGQLTTVEGQAPVRSPRDPLASVRSILANYVVSLG